MITFLPETEGSTLVVEAAGKLTTHDYEKVFIPKLNELVQQYGKIRLAFYFNDSFDGWELGAMWDDAKFGLQHSQHFERIALIGGPPWLAWLTRLSARFLHCEVKTVGPAAFPEALAWIRR